MKKYSFLYFTALLVSLSGLLSGFDTGVISGAILYIENYFNLTPKLSGLLVSSVSIGAIIGALTNGLLIDKFGRKNILILSSIIFLLGTFFCSISQSINQLIISRIFTGCAVGIVSFAAPLYLSEISIKEKRGKIVSFYQIAITLGILFSYLINFSCSNFENNWRIMLFMGAIPAFILLLGMFFQKDTPRWYILKNKTNEAKKTLKKFISPENINKEIEEIKKTIVNDKINFNKKLLKPFVIGIGIMFCQIATGINIIIYYAPTIFKQIGFSSNQDALMVTIFIGIINFLMTFVAIIFVDKLGRKPLLFIGLSGMLFSLLILAFAFISDFHLIKYLAIIACGIYIISFSMSLGPIALLLISEIFPLKFRGQAMSIAIVSNFIFNFIVTGLFPIALNHFGGFVTFLAFALTCVLSLFFVYFLVPETKGLSLEEIELKFKN